MVSKPWKVLSQESAQQNGNRLKSARQHSFFTFAQNLPIMQKCLLTFAVVFLLIKMVSAQTETPLELSATTNQTPSFILTDPKEVLKHEGELVVVEGCVASATLMENINGKPLFINMFDPYPRNLFSVVIWGQDQAYFLLAAGYDKKKVRISGMVEKSKTKERYTISLRNPKQITILGDCQ